jgi:RNA polymerase primary sigma factor
MDEATLRGLWAAIEGLPERARRVLVRRYGLDNRGETTVRQLAREMGVSDKTVRRAQREAERLLRAGISGHAKEALA